LKSIIPFLFLFISFVGFSQAKKINILYSGISYTDEEKFPGATVLLKDNDSLVTIEHEGAVLTCNQAFFYKKSNFFKAIGNVTIRQGDTITQTSNYTDYDGNSKQVLSWGNVVLTDPQMTLTTDTLHFDRAQQKLFYKNSAIIKDSTNTLKSKVGDYYLKEKKFTATSKVVVTNPEHILKSNHLDYYTNSAFAYLYGPSTIKGKDNTIYTERGFYDTKREISHFVKNPKIFFTDRTIEGDSLYYDKFKGFASATNHMKLVDTVQNFVAKGNYAEYFELKDSVFIIKKAVAITEIDKDSMYIHGDKILITGKTEKRIVRIYHDVKIFKSDLQGKCDSIHTNQESGLTRMYRNPVLWSDKNQITGDSIQLLNNIETEKLDSLKILGNALIVQLDTIIDDVATYNQIKGRNMYGKFIEGKLKYFLVKGNAEVVFYNRNEKGIIETITKQECSSIEFELDDTGKINWIKYIKKPEGKSYPPKELPEKDRKLEGFVWRQDEQPLRMEDIFIKGTKNLRSDKTPTKKQPKKIEHFDTDVKRKKH
jgi:lipopolysaccharide export system protein LptA